MPRAAALREGLASLGSALAGAFAPPLCWGCSGLTRPGDPLCPGCRASLHRLPAESLFLSGVRVWAPVAYSGPARDLVRALKFRGALAVADAMAAQIVANAPPGLLDDAIAIAESPWRLAAVPVPLHPKRLRSRGYNQAAVIAEAIGRRARVEVIDCLARTGASVTQVGRDRGQRRAGPAGSIELRPPRGRGAPPSARDPGAPPSARGPGAPPSARGPGAAPSAAGRGAPPSAGGGGVPFRPPARVLLVDDVVTTGATLGACRDALVAAGAREVTAVVFARTIGR